MRVVRPAGRRDSFSDQPFGPSVWKQLGRKARSRGWHMRMGLPREWGLTASSRISPFRVCGGMRIQRQPNVSWTSIWERHPPVSSFSRRIIWLVLKKGRRVPPRCHQDGNEDGGNRRFGAAIYGMDPGIRNVECHCVGGQLPEPTACTTIALTLSGWCALLWRP